MNKSANIFLGWSMATMLVVAACIGLPKLAGASTSVKEQVRWKTRAESYQASNFGNKSYSGLVEDLAKSQLDTSITNPWMRDLETVDLGGLDSHRAISYAKAARREVQCLAEAVYYEARSETKDGQKAVAEVVLNRVKHKAFPNTICGVVYEGAERTTGCQFSFACDGSTANLPRGKSWQRAQDIAAHMIMGLSPEITRRATHYHTTGVNPAWAQTLRQTRQFDTHVFYRFMPRKSLLRPVSVAP
ncbi:MAG TPA: cell wall hydrolase [Hellea balneolensis]|uniref:Cell wall hydrolase n=1 Tax=Hellea balneolensis TaxID=287478 RepID=A0A7C5QWQ5_9PROT|nr:cell wall hydrolase [Hellea balneolensis]